MRRQGSPGPAAGGSAGPGARSTRCSTPGRSPSSAPAPTPPSGVTSSPSVPSSRAGDRPVLLVNRRGGEVLGRRDPPTLAEAARALGEPAGPGRAVRARHRLRGGGDGGGRGRCPGDGRDHGRVLRAGPEGAAAEAEAVAMARAAGAVLVGPNCLGIVDTSAGPAAQPTPSSRPATWPCSARAATWCSTSRRCCADRGLGVSRFVSLGNQADLTVVDLMHACVSHDGTRRRRRLHRGRGRRPRLRGRGPGAGDGRASRWCCWLRVGPTRRCAARRRTPAR